MAIQVFFDLDGTLVNSAPGIQWSVEAALKRSGFDAQCPDLRRLIGPPIRTILAGAAGAGFGMTEGALDKLERNFRSIYDSDGWKRTLLQPGVRAMLDQLLAAGNRLSIVTNKPAHATGLILTELAIDYAFSEIVCRDSVSPPFNSKAEMLAHLLGRSDISRRKSILVGDTLEDCNAAVEAGTCCGVVGHGYGRGLEGGLPDGCWPISEWDELVIWCRNTGGPAQDKLPRRTLAMRNAGTR